MTLRALWDLSLALNALALSGRRSLSWRIWATWYLAGNGFLRWMDYAHTGHANPVWCVVQIGSTVLLANVVRYEIDPTPRFVLWSFLSASLPTIALGATYHWQHSPVETVLFTTGYALLACGLMASLTALATFRHYVLAGYLLGSALLALGGVEYAATPALGIAVCLLDCLAFGAWAIDFGFFCRNDSSRRTPA